MSDWGAPPRWADALKGLDQEAGVQMDGRLWTTESFVEPLKAAYAEGKLPKERLVDRVRRLLRSMSAVGVARWGPASKVDMAKPHEGALGQSATDVGLTGGALLTSRLFGR
jgi:beta-glucosidase